MKIKIVLTALFVLVLYSISYSVAHADWNYIYEDFEKDFIDPSGSGYNYNEWQMERKIYLDILQDENHANNVPGGGLGYMEVDFGSSGDLNSIIKQQTIYTGNMPKAGTEFWFNYTGNDTSHSSSIVSMKNADDTTIGLVTLTNLSTSTYSLNIKSTSTSTDMITLTKNKWYKLRFYYDASAAKELVLIIEGVGTISHDAVATTIGRIHYGKISYANILGKLQIDNISILVPEITELWVDPTIGSDDNSGISPSSPFRTIEKAVTCSGPGTTIHLMPGVYNSNLRAKINFRGLNPKNEYLTLKGEGATPDNTILDASDLIFDSHNGAIIHIKSDYVKVSNLSITNSDGYGILVEGRDDKRISNIDVDHVNTRLTEKSGIHFNSTKNIKLTNNNVMAACGYSEDKDNYPQECITVTHTAFFEISNNKVFEGVNGTNGGEGITVKGNSYNGNVFNNEVYDLPGDVGIYVGSVSSGTPQHPELGVYNINIFNNKVHNSECGIAVSSEVYGHTQDIVICNNIVYDNTAHGIVVTKWNKGTPGTKYNIDIFNNTIYHNALVEEHGLDIQCKSVDEIKNIRVWNNIISKNVNSQFSVSPEGLKEVSICNNLIDGYIPDDGEIDPADTSVCTDCISGDPGFVNESERDLSLLENSIAINMGKPVYIDIDFDGNLDLLSFDYVYNKRPSKNAFDLGAFEFQFKSGLFEDFQKDFITNPELNFNKWEFQNESYLKILNDNNDGYLNIDFERAFNNGTFTGITQTGFNENNNDIYKKVKTEFWINYTGTGFYTYSPIVAFNDIEGINVGYIGLHDSTSSSKYGLYVKSTASRYELAVLPRVLSLYKNRWYKVTCTFDSDSGGNLIMTVDNVGSLSSSPLKNGINQIQFGRLNVKQSIPTLTTSSNLRKTKLSAQLKFDNISVTLP